MSTKLLKLSEVAETLDVTYDRIAQMAREGILPGVRLGRQIRVNPDTLQSWIDNGGQALPGGWRKAAVN